MSKELIIDLRNPTYQNGTLTTNEGGFIKNQDIRIQAKFIQYMRKKENGKSIHRVEAREALMVQYKR